MKLTIGHLYPDLLNLYGDRGNIQCLMKRCQWRGIEAETIAYEIDVTIDFSNLDIVPLGGGSDREQMLVCEKLKTIQKDFKAYVEDNGVVITICRYYLIHYLQKFHQEFPDVRIKVTNSTSIGCAELLEKGQVDLIVCNSPNSRLGNHMNIKVLRDFRDIFVGNPDCFSPEEIPCELKTLLKQPILMLSSKSTTSEYLHQMFATHGLNLLPEVELNSNDLLMDLARIGLGIACIPDYMLNPDDSLKPIPLADPLPPRQLVLVQHNSLPLSQAAERFLDMFS